MKKNTLLNRDRINTILAEALNYPLTIIEAPMGYGKTTAIRNFIKNEGRLCLWIGFLNSRESSDIIWSKFTKEITKVSITAGNKLKNLGVPDNLLEIEQVLSILNQIKFKRKTVFVLDDYHLLQHGNMHNLFFHIVMEEIENLHLVIATRDTTNINFAELFSKGMCYVIPKEQVIFTKEELKDYCRMLKSDISENDINKVYDYTQGWISIAYMKMLGLIKGVSVGINKSIDELVNDSLFSKYDDDTQRFMLKLSIVDDFDEKQAEFFTEEEKASEILTKLLGENAFVFYDEETRRYKIHNVLLDFLRKNQSFTSVELEKLYSRLGEWYFDKRDFITAFGYFNLAGQSQRILSELNNPSNISNELSAFDGSFEMFEGIKEEILNKYPLAYLQHILLSIFKGDSEIISINQKRLDKLIAYYENAEDIDEEYKKRIIAEALIVKKFTKFNYLKEMSLNSERILKLLNGKQSYIMLRQNEFTFGSPHMMYLYFRDKGTFKDISDFAKEKLPIHAMFSNGCGIGSEYLAAAEYALETGDFEAVEMNSLKAIYKAQTKDQTSIIICAYFNLIRLYILKNDIAQAISKLKEIDEAISDASRPIYLYNTTIDLCKGYIYACLNQYVKIPDWLRIGDSEGIDFLYNSMAFNYIVYGKAVMVSKNFIQLEMLTESFEEHFKTFNHRLGFIHNGIFKAVAHYELYSKDEGAAKLLDILNQSEPDGIIMPFIENAPYITEILKILVKSNGRNKHIKKILKYCEQYNLSLTNSKVDQVKLSKREIEVLSLVAEGLKREDIALRLMLSTGTVRTHLQNIYKKLGVKDRVSAIRSGKLMKIIS